MGVRTLNEFSVENEVMILILSIGKPTLVSAGLGVFAGLYGVLYGLRAQQFVRHGHFSHKQPESYTPTWLQRFFVVSVSAAALIWSVMYLIKHW